MSRINTASWYRTADAYRDLAEKVGQARHDCACRGQEDCRTCDTAWDALVALTEAVDLASAIHDGVINREESRE